MAEGTQLFNQAQVMLRDCLGLQRGEELLILWDGTVGQELVAASQYAALSLGARPLLLSFDPLVHRPVREYGLFAGASMLPTPLPVPRSIVRAIEGADRLLFALSDSAIFHFSPDFKEAVRDCTALRLGYLTAEAARRLLPESTEEVLALRELTHRVADIFSRARRARITSRAGTELDLTFGQHDALILDDGVATRGKRRLLPGGQVSRIPDDGSAVGRLVIDRSIGGNDYKELPQPVRMEVRGGNVVSVSGGTDAERFSRFLSGMADPSIYHLTELGIGTNHRCRYTGVVVPSEDTHTLGAISLALGCDLHLGGWVRAGAHVDMTMHFPTLELDGEVVVAEGALL